MVGWSIGATKEVGIRSLCSIQLDSKSWQLKNISDIDTFYLSKLYCNMCYYYYKIYSSVVFTRMHYKHTHTLTNTHTHSLTHTHIHTHTHTHTRAHRWAFDPRQQPRWEVVFWCQPQMVCLIEISKVMQWLFFDEPWNEMITIGLVLTPLVASV